MIFKEFNLISEFPPEQGVEYLGTSSFKELRIKEVFYTWNDALVLKNHEKESFFNHLVLPVQRGLSPSCIPQILLILPDISEIPPCEASAPTPVRDYMSFFKFFAFPPFIH